MKINCNIADDLMPLYIDGACSADSREAVEEHLKSCESCRRKYGRMSAEEPEVRPEYEHSAAELSDVAKRIRRRRGCLAVIVTIVVLVSALVLAAVCMAVVDMHHIANPNVYETEKGVHNLTAEELRVPADEAFEYQVFTNFTQIKVEVVSDEDFEGKVMLWNADYD